MHKFSILLMGAVLFASGISHASAHRGQKVYIKNCRDCHSSGKDLAGSKTMDEWDGLMQKKGRALAEFHSKTPKAKASFEYFNSDKYKKDTKNLRDFMREYAKDSGKVPACN